VELIEYTMKPAHKILIGAFAAIGVASTLAMIATPAFAQEREDESHEKSSARSAPTVKVTPVQAMSAAERKTGGKAAMANFEFDEGHWIYAVIVAKNHKLMEVEVNSETGKVDDSEDATPEGEAKEFQQELTRLIK
jgi:uncharacterized membrane protein YkoI